MIITLCNQKGGVAKTATAINLMAAARLHNPKLRGFIVDLDNKTATARRYTGSIEGVTWCDALPKETRDSDLIIIDTPGNIDESFVPALAISDLVIAPCVPDDDSIDGTRKTIIGLADFFAQNPNVGARLLFTRCRSNKAFQDFLMGARLASWDAFETTIPAREGEFDRARKARRPVVDKDSKGVASNAYKALWHEIAGV